MVRVRNERPFGSSTVTRRSLECLAAWTVKRSDGRRLASPDTRVEDTRGELLDSDEGPEPLVEGHPWIVKCADGAAVLSPF
jgi:hypothetical protein